MQQRNFLTPNVDLGGAIVAHILLGGAIVLHIYCHWEELDNERERWHQSMHCCSVVQ